MDEGVRDRDTGMGTLLMSAVGRSSARYPTASCGAERSDPPLLGAALVKKIPPCGRRLSR